MTYTWNTSVGIWAFGISPTRFMPGGYHPEVADLDVVERLKRAVDGLGPLVKGYEFHYETEIDERNLEQIRTVLGRDHRIATICYGLVPNPRFQLGALINPDPGKRREAVAHMKRAIDMAAEVGARFIYWPGNEGYNYSFQRDYATTWGWFLEGIQETVEHANKKNVIYLLEHKNSEPAMQILMRNVASAMFIVKKIAEMGTDTRNLKINMDWQHLIMNNEPLPEYAALLAREGLLGHQHGNSGWGAFDDDNMVGASFFWQTVELAKVLQQVKYGANGEWLAWTSSRTPRIRWRPSGGACCSGSSSATSPRRSATRSWQPPTSGPTPWLRTRPCSRPWAWTRRTSAASSTCTPGADAVTRRWPVSGRFRSLAEAGRCVRHNNHQSKNSRDGGALHGFEDPAIGTDPAGHPDHRQPRGRLRRPGRTVHSNSGSQHWRHLNTTKPVLALRAAPGIRSRLPGGICGPADPSRSGTPSQRPT